MIPKFLDLLDIFSDEKKCINYLFEKGALDKIDFCPNCNSEMSIRDNIFRCKTKSCRKKISIFRNSFFGKTKLRCNVVLLIGYLWLSGCTHSMILSMTGHSSRTITDFLHFYRQLISESIDEDDMLIGGEGVEVEIDESKFAKRKYHRGRMVEGCWIVGGVEKTPQRKIFVEIVENRDNQTLSDVIARHVLPGSIVLTDCWKGYCKIENNLPIIHKTVNHSKYFTDPITQVNTNTIEGTWSGMKRKIPIRNRNADTMNSHIFEFIWRRLNKDNLWEGLFKALKDTLF